MESPELQCDMSKDQDRGSGSVPPGAKSSCPDEKSYYGALCSLYPTLDSSIVPRLEHAVALGRVRAFDQALELFQAISCEVSRNPIIAIEHAQVLWRQWSLLKCSEILEEALEFGRQNIADFNKHGIYSLLRIFKGKLNVFTRGDFTLARDSMREVRSWLAEMSHVKYTDVEVGAKIDIQQLITDDSRPNASCIIIFS